MSDAIAQAEEPTTGQSGEAEHAEEGGSRLEVALAILISAFFLLGPLIYFQYRYELFISETGDIREGAAGATLALAVIFRTVSRTVLRTIIRTSARAGMKASMKGALQAGMRVLFASMFKGTFGAEKEKVDPSKLRMANIKSLAFASVLLYASWVIVVGLGQPFTDLKTAEQAEAAMEAEAEERRRVIEKRRGPAIAAFHAQEEVDRLEGEVRGVMKDLKMERSAEGQRDLETKLIILAHDEDDAKDKLSLALEKSNGTVLDPEELKKEPPPTPADAVFARFFARAPFPGATEWGSMVIWLGGLIVVLPLWFIYFVQSGLAKSLGVVLRHETGVDGGVIQLYFAGAFSFMPLTSDVIVEGSDATKGKVALAGLIGPALVAMALWFAWKATGNQMVLFAADAFLIYPMVQTFPLDPLDGVRVWRWNKLIWFAVFLFIMSGFLLAGSEGLKNVI
ncbi:MAG: hypothetical protein KDA24_14655 [Deltaproteobacteria bacterium]|nr:hypothetical protein [Deltaproteobacteria bacterium]